MQLVVFSQGMGSDLEVDVICLTDGVFALCWLPPCWFVIHRTPSR